jgi:hypothetical protein
MLNLLIDEYPIMFLPSLAKALGSCERAIVLQQIHWLLRLPNSGRDEDGHHWVWGSYEEWCKGYFTMWSPHTLAKHIRHLEDAGVLISAQLRAKEHDRTKFYRINYETLHSILPHPVVSNTPNEVVSNTPDAVVSLYSTKTSSKTTAEGGKRPQRAQGNEKRNYRPDEYADIILG